VGAKHLGGRYCGLFKKIKIFSFSGEKKSRENPYSRKSPSRFEPVTPGMQISSFNTSAYFLDWKVEEVSSALHTTAITVNKGSLYVSDYPFIRSIINAGNVQCASLHVVIYLCALKMFYGVAMRN
jgi:hypothetical protein